MPPYPLVAARLGTHLVHGPLLSRVREARLGLVFGVLVRTMCVLRLPPELVHDGVEVPDGVLDVRLDLVVRVGEFVRLVESGADGTRREVGVGRRVRAGLAETAQHLVQRGDRLLQLVEIDAYFFSHAQLPVGSPWLPAARCTPPATQKPSLLHQPCVPGLASPGPSTERSRLEEAKVLSTPSVVNATDGGDHRSHPVA